MDLIPVAKIKIQIMAFINKAATKIKILNINNQKNNEMTTFDKPAYKFLIENMEMKNEIKFSAKMQEWEKR
jgi:hypothetical protein